MEFKRRKETIEYLLLRHGDALIEAIGRAVPDAGDRERLTGQLRSASGQPKPHKVFGLRAESVFRELVVALGQVTYLKEEDQGAWADFGVAAQPTDFLLGTKSGARLAVEVKNCNAQTGSLRLKIDYFDRLKAFAGLVGHDLRIAMYWSQWRSWTLVPPQAFRACDGDKLEVDFARAFAHNEMCYLGDRLLHTTPALGIRVKVTTLESLETGDDEFMKKFRIEDFRFVAGDAVLRTERDLRIALHLFQYGTWRADGWKYRQNDEGEWVELLAKPAEDQEDDDVLGNRRAIGFLSQHYSNAVSSLLAEDSINIPEGFAGFNYGGLDRVVPRDFDFAGSEISLMVFELFPEHHGGLAPNTAAPNSV